MDLLKRWNELRWDQLNELEELRCRLGGPFSLSAMGRSGGAPEDDLAALGMEGAQAAKSPGCEAGQWVGELFPRPVAGHEHIERPRE